MIFLNRLEAITATRGLAIFQVKSINAVMKKFLASVVMILTFSHCSQQPGFNGSGSSGKSPVKSKNQEVTPNNSNRPAAEIPHNVYAVTDLNHPLLATGVEPYCDARSFDKGKTFYQSKIISVVQNASRFSLKTSQTLADGDLLFFLAFPRVMRHRSHLS